MQATSPGEAGSTPPTQIPIAARALNIQDTYTPKREKMFRRWLLSLPEGMDEDVDAPINASGWDDTNSVVLVGEGSLGDAAQTNRIRSPAPI